MGADARQSRGQDALVRYCLEQLGRLYGPDAQRLRGTIFKDWAADSLTVSEDDRSATGHLAPSSSPWIAGAWRERLSLGASETSPKEPGCMADAVCGAQEAVAEVAERLRHK